MSRGKYLSFRFDIRADFVAEPMLWVRLAGLLITLLIGFRKSWVLA